MPNEFFREVLEAGGSDASSGWDLGAVIRRAASAAASLTAWYLLGSTPPLSTLVCMPSRQKAVIRAPPANGEVALAADLITASRGLPGRLRYEVTGTLRDVRTRNFDPILV